MAVTIPILQIEYSKGGATYEKPHIWKLPHLCPQEMKSPRQCPLEDWDTYRLPAYVQNKDGGAGNGISQSALTAT